MKIYEQEKRDGIEELILSKASVKFDTEVKPITFFSQASKNKSLDISELESVLASVGWNENDDVFDPIETWKARSTPINKKFNYMHNEKDIIGHMTKAYVVDSEGNIIPDDTPEEDLPELFDIVVNSVLYTYWEDKELQARANTLKEEIPQGKWFVSMEVLFPDFDYAISKGSEQKIIERNSDTSFLTKYLRVYNGKGEYEGWKIGRKLKDMFFSGKGLVDNPANKRSLITSFSGAKASVSIFNEVKMSVEQKDYDKAVAELGATKKELETVTKQIDILSGQVDSLKGDLDSSKAINKDLQDKIKELENLNSEKELKVVEVNKALAEVLENAQKTKRVSRLVSEGLELERAEELVVKFAKASDEMFEEVVALNKVALKSKASKVEDETNNLENTKAEEGLVQDASDKDETAELLEKASAFISETLKKKEVK